MRYAFLGAGNMAGAIIRRLRARGEAVTVYDVNPAAMTALTGCGAVPAPSPEALADADVLFLAVKPQQMASALPPVAQALARADKPPLIISIAAGKTLMFLAEQLGDLPIVRVMPNINALAGEAMSIYCGNARVTPGQLDAAREALETFGAAMELPESQFAAASALVGCAPGYTLLYLDALATAGVNLGLSKAAALRLAAQSTLGTALLLREEGAHPRELLDRVCSPGGTTVAGIAALQRLGFEAAVAAAVEASYDRDRQL